MRPETVKKYIDKYSLGVVEIENSLEQYNSYLRNMGIDEPVEKLIEKRLSEKVFVKIMDVGCGNGGFLSDIKKVFEDSVHTIGVDLLAAEKHPDEMVIGDALELQFPPEVDFIFSFRSMHEIGEPEKMIAKIYNSLSAGGRAFLSIRTMDMYLGGRGIAEIGEKDIKLLQRIVREGKMGGIKAGGFEVSVKDYGGKKHVAGINIILEK